MVEFNSNTVWKQVDELKVNGVNPNYVPPAIEKDIKEHIQKEGFKGHIIINSDNWVVDGKHRLAILKNLGVKKVPCLVEGWDARKSKIEMLRLNRERGFIAPLEASQLVEELHAEYEMPIDDIVEETKLTYGDIQSYLDLEVIQKSLAPKDVEVKMWGDVTSAAAKLCSRLKGEWDTVYTISRGGLIPARLVADKLQIKNIKVDVEPPDGALFIDDCYDTGKTFEKFPNVTFGVLFAREGAPCVYGYKFEKWLIFPWERKEFADRL